jgi:hypothetical protein
VAHDNFDTVIAAAQDPNSILNKLKFIEIDEAAAKSKEWRLLRCKTPSSKTFRKSRKR